MRDIVVAIQNENQKVSVIQTIHAIAKSGYKNVFVQWYDKDWEYTQEEQVRLCKELGLNIVFAHLGYQNINSIWLEGEEGDNLVERYKRNFRECKENGIQLVVMHLCSGKKSPMYNEIGFKRIKELSDYAKTLEIKIAFENTRMKGYLEYILTNLKDKHLGVCFDIGHYHAHFKDEFNFELFKDRIFAVHLHDNDQIDDLHLLPFDGTVNWEESIKKLKKANYTGPVTLELCYRYQYLDMPLEKFYKEGYIRGEKIRNIFEEGE